MSGDASWSSVSLLLHCDGSNGSTTFADSGPDARTVSRTGTPTITTAQSKWGGASADIAGSGNYLTSAAGAQWDFGTGNFTIEMWMRSTSTSSFQTIASLNSWSSGSGDWSLYTRFDSQNKVVFIYKNDASYVEVATSTINTHDGSWHHIAVTRSGSTIRIFVDGAQLGSGTYAGQIGRSDKTLTLGALPGDGRSFTGNLDDIRITKGVARYTSAFTAPTEAFPDGPPPNEVLLAIPGPLGDVTILAAHSFASIAIPGPLGDVTILAALPTPVMVDLPGPLGNVAVLAAVNAQARMAIPGPLGDITVLAVSRYASISLPGPLGDVAIKGTVPTACFVSLPGPLGSPSVVAWHDFTAQVPATAILRYVADFITPTGTVRVPISSWQGTLRTDASNYLQCVVPAATDVIDTLAAATDMIISRAAVLKDGSSIEYEMARTPIDTRSFAGGTANYTATISGYSAALLADADPPTVFDRVLTGVRQVSDDNGSIRIRADVDWLLRPGMRAYHGATELIVDYINYYVPGNDQFMEVGESA